MFDRTKKVSNLRQPKIFTAPKEKKKSTLPKFLILIILAAVALAGLIFIIYFSPIFQIKNVEIIGTPPQEITDTLNHLEGHNLFLFNSGSLEHKIINGDHNFLKVKIYRGIPDTIRIVFESREPKIIWQTNEKKYLMDKDAIAFKEADQNSSLPLVVDNQNLPLKIPSEIATSNFVSFVIMANDSLQKAGFKVKQFEVNETVFQINASVEQGFIIKLNTLRPISDQISALEQTYEKNKNDIKEYMDVRVEGWVYYK